MHVCVCVYVFCELWLCACVFVCMWCVCCASMCVSVMSDCPTVPLSARQSRLRGYCPAYPTETLRGTPFVPHMHGALLLQ